MAGGTPATPGQAAGKTATGRGAAAAGAAGLGGAGGGGGGSLQCEAAAGAEV